MTFHYLRRFKLDGGCAVDMGIVDIPEEMVAETLKNNPLWKDLGEVGSEPAETPIEAKDIIECPICGFVAKNEKSLRMHKMKKH